MVEKKVVEMIEFYEKSQPLSLKQQLVAALACGDKLGAEELRMLLKIEPSETMGQSKRRRA